jgi:phytoene desaturase
LHVDVYERADAPGGKAGTLELGDFRFDTGPSLVTMADVLKEPFRDCGRDADDYLTFSRLEPICNYFWPDGTTLSSHHDVEAFGREVEARTRDGAEELRRYLRYSQRIYDVAGEQFLFKSISEGSSLLNWSTFKALLRSYRMDVRRTMHKANASFFEDPKMVQLFDRYATYNGSNPYWMPATFNLIQHVEYGLGAYTVDGGIHSIPKALERLAREEGAEFHYGTEVERVLLDGKRVTGVRTAGGDHEYDAVVSNADVVHTYGRLLGDTTSKPARRYDRLEPSSSALVLYWGIKDTFDQLDIHNILFSPDYREEFRDLFERKRCPAEPTVYIHIMSKHVPTDAPPGCEAWFTMVNAPHVAGQDWDAELERTREAIKARIEAALGIELEGLIVEEEVLTPVDIEARTSGNRGALYGISSNTRMSAFVRQRNRSKHYRGLYFAGGSAHPGGGMPLAVLSGKIASGLVLKFT